MTALSLSRTDTVEIARRLGGQLREFSRGRQLSPRPAPIRRPLLPPLLHAFGPDDALKSLIEGVPAILFASCRTHHCRGPLKRRQDGRGAKANSM